MDFNDDESEEPVASMVTSSTTKTSGRVKKDEVSMVRHLLHIELQTIHQVRRKGEPMEPTNVISIFSNTCGVVVEEKVPVTYSHWKHVPDHLKTYVWEEDRRSFT